MIKKLDGSALNVIELIEKGLKLCMSLITDDNFDPNEFNFCLCIFLVSPTPKNMNEKITRQLFHRLLESVFSLMGPFETFF
jgi:hypothetical protein